MGKKYGVWAVRSAASIFGEAQSWCKNNGQPIEFDTMAEAESYAKELNETMRSENVNYYAKEKESERQVILSAQPEKKPSIREHLRSQQPNQEHRHNPSTKSKRER